MALRATLYAIAFGCITSIRVERFRESLVLDEGIEYMYRRTV